MSNNPLKKTTSFLSKQSASVEPPLANNPPGELPYVPKKTYMIDFPTSPESQSSGEQVFHSSHPLHPLCQRNYPDLFKCAGCKEYGSGKRFSCPQCDFQLHDFCALAPPALKAHPFHSHHQLLFSSKPVKGGIRSSKCDVCGKATKGYIFKCNACNFQIHPCCAMLSNEINISIHSHPLKLLPATVTLPNGGVETGAVFACGECNRRRSGRAYQCTVCEYHLHAVCAKNMVNGLHANGIKPPEKPSMLGTAARLASQVVVEFIGGLIEGIGESVGEALIQNTVRGNRLRRSASSN